LRQGVSNADWLSDEVRLWFCPKMVCTGLVGTPAARTPILNFSEQLRAGMPDKGLGIAAVSLEHFQAAVAGHVGDLDQVRAALHRRGHEACPQAMAGEGRTLEPELASPVWRDAPPGVSPMPGSTSTSRISPHSSRSSPVGPPSTGASPVPSNGQIWPRPSA
jgi:hypothetical protein